ncbi:hypothetical protein DQY68_26800, partial [Salmonella enterica subsp. salamae]|nr:hypothetical protein [Salmonella enterica subsp. salamae]
MKLPNRIIIVLFIAACIGVLSWSTRHYYGKYQQEQKRASIAEDSLKVANATITGIQQQQQQNADLDAR